MRDDLAGLWRRIQLRRGDGDARRADRHDHEQTSRRASGTGETEIGGLGSTSMSNDDAKLVALTDNELDEDARPALLARLAADDQLRQRYENAGKRAARSPPRLARCLSTHPARLRAALLPDHPRRQAPRRFRGITLRELAAGVIVRVLAASAAHGSHRALGCLADKKIGAPRSPNTRISTRRKHSVVSIQRLQCRRRS